jgi:hypothetical protein
LSIQQNVKFTLNNPNSGGIMKKIAVIFPEDEITKKMTKDVLEQMLLEIKTFVSIKDALNKLGVLDDCMALIVPLGGKKFYTDQTIIVDLYKIRKIREILSELKIFIIDDTGYNKNDEPIEIIKGLCDGIVHIPFWAEVLSSELKKMLGI